MSAYQLAHKNDSPYELAERKGGSADDESIPYEIARVETPVDDVSDKMMKKRKSRNDQHVPSIEKANQQHDANAPYELARHSSVGVKRHPSDPVYEMASSKLHFTDEELLVRSGQLVSELQSQGIHVPHMESL